MFFFRLSEIASAKLRHNNANVADLSDPNRATKLAERLSELYDNEWTDVFDAVRKMTNPKDVDDRAIVKSLLDILRVSLYYISICACKVSFI